MFINTKNYVFNFLNNEDMNVNGRTKTSLTKLGKWNDKIIKRHKASIEAITNNNKKDTDKEFYENLKWEILEEYNITLKKLQAVLNRLHSYKRIVKWLIFLSSQSLCSQWIVDILRVALTFWLHATFSIILLALCSASGMCVIVLVLVLKKLYTNSAKVLLSPMA